MLLYATWSEGFRPGGINRNPFVGDYEPDFLTNWELGWKTQWAGNSLQFNGAVFFLEWDDLQRAFPGANGITQVDNAPSAEITGTEVQLLWAVTDNFRLSAAAAYYDTELTSDYFEIQGGVPVVTAPAGTQLPITPDFKGNLIARYDFPLGDFEAHLQGALTYESSRPSELVPAENDVEEWRHPIEHGPRPERRHRPGFLARRVVRQERDGRGRPPVYRTGVRGGHLLRSDVRPASSADDSGTQVLAGILITKV